MISMLEEFRDAIQSAGLTPPAAIAADGSLHRFSSNGEPQDRAGWYVCHPNDPAAGAFGDWRTGISGTWSAKNERHGHLAAMRRSSTGQAALRAARLAEEVQRQGEARRTARLLWEAARPAPEEHPYLVAKGVGVHGLRAQESALLVPLHDDEGLSSLQFIQADGDKRFLTGGRVAGCHFLIGAPGPVICIAEGLATAASVHEATGHAVSVAFNAGNLLPVAQKLRARFPAARIIVCADDDIRTSGNPGLTKAREAALAIGADIAVPDFGDDRPQRASDFNDLHRHAGLSAVRAIVEAAGPAVAATVPDQYDWPEPKPIHGELRPVPPFDAETLLPESLRSWIMDEAGRMPCPPEFIAVAALVALGSVIGARCAIKPKSHDTWLVVPNLWGGIVGDPSAKKSPAWNAALKPLDRLIAKALEAHTAALADHETEALVFAARKEAVEGRVKAAAKKADKGEPVVIAKELRILIEQAPDVPKLRRYKTNDSTVEKLGELLRENPTGLLVLRDELVGLIAMWDREGREGERAFFLEAWNGNQSFDTDRIGRGHVSIPNVCISLFGGIQPDKLIGYLEQSAHALANDGMLQRFQLLVYPDACPWEWRDRSPNKSARDDAFAIFDALAEFDPVAWGAAPSDAFTKFPHFHFDEAAQQVFIEWSRDLHTLRMQAEDEAIMRQHLAKYDKLAPALALIFHLVDCASNNVRGPVIREAVLRAAAWCEFLEAHARRCYGLLKDDGLRAAQALAAKLQRGELEDGFTARDVRRHQWRYLTTEEAVAAALDWLEDEGWLRGAAIGGTGPGTGRRTCIYTINPRLRRRQKGGAE